MPWRGEWAWALDWSAGTTILAGPVVSGFVAYETGLWQPVTKHLLMSTSRRRLAALATPLLGILFSAWFVYLLGVLFAVATTAKYHPTDNFQPELVPLGMLLLVVYAAIGWVLGTVLKPVVAAVLATVVAYGLIIFSSGLGVERFLRIGGSTGSLAGQDVNRTTVVSYSCLMIACLLVAVMLVARHEPTLRRLTKGAFGVFVVVSLVGLYFAPSESGGLYQAARPQERLCQGSPVHVCLLKGNTRFLGAWSSAINAGVRGLQPFGFNYPVQYDQPDPGGLRPAGVGEIFFDPARMNLDPPAMPYVVQALVAPATCPAFAVGPPPREALEARDWLATWIGQQLWPAETAIENPFNYQQWSRLTPPRVRAAWARKTFEGLRTCDLTRVRVPGVS